MKISIIDYKINNMFSIENALKNLGFECEKTSNAEDLLRADGAILPGVGSFREAMHFLNTLNLANAIRAFISSGKPFMGICLGMQLLFARSEEFGDSEGLGIFDGPVQNLSNYIMNEPVPHVGWNKVINHTNSGFNRLGVYNDEYYYFVHSYVARPANEEDIFTLTDYGGCLFCSSVLKENVLATQFHPEKSGQKGLEILSRFFSV